MARILKTCLYGSVAAATMLAATATRAIAQEAGSSALEEVVVTAQKREERLQDVPISITAVTSKSLDAKGIYDSQQLQQIAPGLSFRRTTGSGQLFLRGIGAYNTSIGDENPTALYIDGVYIPSMTANLFAMNNIERIEVLRGPQGTLFGRNAAGGVVQIVTKDPTQQTSGSATASYASYQKTRFTAYANGGLTDELAGNLAVMYQHQGKGWGRNLTTGQKAFYDNNLGVRGKLRLDLGATVATLSADYNKFDGDYGRRTTPAPGSRPLTGDTYRGFYTASGDLNESTVTKQRGVLLRVDHDLSWAQFASLSSYRKVTGRNPVDQDGLSSILGTAHINAIEDTYSQEFQLLSPSDSKVTWVTGAYYFHDNSKYAPLQIFTAATAVTTPVFVPSINQTIRAPTAIVNLPATVITTIRSQMKAESYAAYGQATVEVLPRLTLTGGLRYTSDKRKINGAVNTAPVTYQQATFNKLTYKATADYRFNPDVHAYVQYSRGFKSGVFNIVSPTAPSVRPSTVDALEVGLKSQLFDNTVRFNTAAFHYKMKDLQSSQIVLGTQALFNAAKAHSSGFEAELEASPIRDLTVRASAAYLRARFDSFPGAPLSVVNPLPNPLAGPSGYVTYNGDAAGAIMPSAPEWQLQLGADYAIPLAYGRLDLSANASYTDRIYALDNKFYAPAYTIVNASVGWSAPDDRWSVRLMARNLLNRQYVVSRGPGFAAASINQTPGEPQTFELQIGARW